MEKTIEEKEINGTTQFLSFILLFIVAMPYQAYVFAYGWNSIIQPMSGIALTFWVSMGFLILVRFATAKLSFDQKRSDLFAHFMGVLGYTTLMWLQFYLINQLKS